MASYEECMSHADECVRLAGMTGDTTLRDQIIELARGWLSSALRAHNTDARVIEFSGPSSLFQRAKRPW
jgi:hypothetical protein